MVNLHDTNYGLADKDTLMSDVVIVAAIAVIPSILTFILTAAIVAHAWHVPRKMEKLIENTNGLTEKLVTQTALASRAEGVEAERGRADADAKEKAVVILAAAELAADKVLAAAKLAKDAKEKE
jgi:hypothetical protein